MNHFNIMFEHIRYNFRFPIKDTDPKRFSLSDLSYGFNLYLICCGISMFAFVLEIINFLTVKIYYKLRKVIRSKIKSIKATKGQKTVKVYLTTIKHAKVHPMAENSIPE